MVQEPLCDTGGWKEGSIAPYFELPLGELTPSAERRSLALPFELQKEESSWEYNRYRIGY